MDFCLLVSIASEEEGSIAFVVEEEDSSSFSPPLLVAADLLVYGTTCVAPRILFAVFVKIVALEGEEDRVSLVSEIELSDILELELLLLELEGGTLVGEGLLCLPINTSTFNVEHSCLLTIQSLGLSTLSLIVVFLLPLVVFEEEREEEEEEGNTKSKPRASF